MKIFNYTNCDVCMKCRNDPKIELVKSFQLKYVIGFVIVMFIALNVQGLDMKKLIFFKSIRKIQAGTQLNSNCCSSNLTMNILCTLPTHERLRYKKMNRVGDNADFELEKVMTSYFKFSYRDICICFIKCFAYKKPLAYEAQYYRGDFTYYK